MVHRRTLLCVTALCLALAIAGCAQPLPQETPEPVNPNPTKTVQPATPHIQPKVTDASARWLFFGTIVFARYTNDWSMASDLKYAYPFQNMDQFHPENYTDWIADFECPAVPGLHFTSAQEEAILSFNCDPEYLPEVAKYWTAVNLGNNHSGDQGDDGFVTTQEQLAAQGIQYFGAAHPDDIPNACNVILLTVKANLDNGNAEEYLVPFAFCGLQGVFSILTEEEMAPVAQYSTILPTIPWPHSGAEYQAGPDEIKTTFYRRLADLGAEMVIGNHPHWIQPTEAYNGKFILYSLGNFIFDQQTPPETTRSAIIDIAVTVNNPEAIQGWAAIAEQCKGDFDTCQKLVTENNLPKLDLSYAFDFHGSDDSNKLVRPASADQLASIRARLEWDNTMVALGQ
ncbi:MAG: CapA family protein [Propionibacteriaceae bacterium]|jgi:poly-gamma-glutamate synthesis protein (capsule biosynthesis protein)|nr:CapA family protein [Propionibacteriaceae bacterium]